MIFFFKIVLILIFIIIFYQDFKERLVNWFLYVFVGILAFSIHCSSSNFNFALFNIKINLLIVLGILMVCYIYSKVIMKKVFFDEVMGLGDVFFFIAISLGFTVIPFLVLFVFSLVFSLFLHLVLNYKKKELTLPLAGYMSLFYAAIYSLSFLENCNFLFL